MIQRLSQLAILLTPAVAFAHPGHGHTDPDTWQHYLTEPVHVMQLAAIATVGVVASFMWRRRVRRHQQ